MSFYDFDEYERLVLAASALDATAHLIVLLGGEAGLRCGEMIALEWRDVDLGKRQICVQRSDWNGQVTTPKGERLRYVPLTIRLAAAFRDHRHLRSPHVLCQDDGQPLTQMVQYRVLRASRRAKLSQDGVHILRHTLFAPGDAGSAAESDSGVGRTSRARHDAALHAPESGGTRQRDSARSAVGRTEFWRHFGDWEGLRRKD
jgi:integrase